MRNFRQLKVYQKALELAVDIYKFIELIPSKEQFALKSQFRRAVTSISLNIAEGAAKGTDKHFSNYLEHSLGSAYEIETLLILSSKLYALKSKPIYEKTITIQKMIVSLIKSIN